MQAQDTASPRSASDGKKAAKKPKDKKDQAAAAAAAAAAAEKKKEMERTIRAKVGCEKAAYDVQWLLLDPGVSPDALEAAAVLLQPDHYNDIVVERALDGLCGFPSCSEAAPARGQGRKLHVSLSDHKVYDVSGLHNFCGRACAKRSHAYLQRLQPTSIYLRVPQPAETAAAAVAAVAATTAAIVGGGERKAAPEQPPLSAVASAPADTGPAPAQAAAAAPAPPPPASAKPKPKLAAKFDAGATLASGVVERRAGAPNTHFASPAAHCMVEGYAPALLFGSHQPSGSAARAGRPPTGGPRQTRGIAAAAAPVLLDYADVT